MQKNWYIVYTKLNCEKKVSQLLNRKNIENFYPQVSAEFIVDKNVKDGKKPLFKSNLFVHISVSEITIVTQTTGVIGFVFYKGKPAIINEDEVAIVKEFEMSYQNIELEKTSVNLDEKYKFIDDYDYSLDGNIYSTKIKSQKVYLPSLGFIITGKVSNDNFYQRDTIFSQKTSFSHS